MSTQHQTGDFKLASDEDVNAREHRNQQTLISLGIPQEAFQTHGMHPLHRLKLERSENRRSLLEIDLAEIRDILQSKRIFSSDEMQAASGMSVDKDKIRYILDKLPSKGPQAYPCFRDALKACSPWLVKALDETEIAKHTMMELWAELQKEEAAREEKKHGRQIQEMQKQHKHDLDQVKAEINQLRERSTTARKDLYEEIHQIQEKIQRQKTKSQDDTEEIMKLQAQKEAQLQKQITQNQHETEKREQNLLARMNEQMAHNEREREQREQELKAQMQAQQEEQVQKEAQLQQQITQIARESEMRKQEILAQMQAQQKEQVQREARLQKQITENEREAEKREKRLLAQMQAHQKQQSQKEAQLQEQITQLQEQITQSGRKTEQCEQELQAQLMAEAAKVKEDNTQQVQQLQQQISIWQDDQIATQKRREDDLAIRIMKQVHHQSVTRDYRHLRPVSIIGSVGRGPGGRFDAIWDVAATPADTLLVVDYGQSIVHELDVTGKVIRVIGSRGADDGQFDCPRGVAVDTTGRMYVTSNHKAQCLDHTGRFLYKFGQHTLDTPYGITVTDDGHVYIVDGGHHRVAVFAADGTYVTAFGDTQLSSPEYITRYQDTVWVSEWRSHRVTVLDTQGRPVKVIGQHGTRLGEFQYPYGLVAGPNGQVIVCDHYNHRLQIIDCDTHVTCGQLGTRGDQLGQLNQPWGVTVMATGHVVVTEYGGKRLQVFL